MAAFIGFSIRNACIGGRPFGRPPSILIGHHDWECRSITAVLLFVSISRRSYHRCPWRGLGRTCVGRFIAFDLGRG